MSLTAPSTPSSTLHALALKADSMVIAVLLLGGAAAIALGARQRPHHVGQHHGLWPVCGCNTGLADSSGHTV